MDNPPHFAPALLEDFPPMLPLSRAQLQAQGQGALAQFLPGSLLDNETDGEGGRWAGGPQSLRGAPNHHSLQVSRLANTPEMVVIHAGQRFLGLGLDG